MFYKNIVIDVMQFLIFKNIFFSRDYIVIHLFLVK